MIKKLLVLSMLSISLFLTGCGGSSEKENNTIEGVYTAEYFDGYSFKTDGTVIYYESNWVRSDGITRCEPEYWYGTYSIEEKALKIQLSGVDSEITGVLMDDGIIVIDGIECEKMEKSYMENGADDDSWAELDEKIGLD